MSMADRWVCAEALRPDIESYADGPGRSLLLGFYRSNGTVAMPRMPGSGSERVIDEEDADQPEVQRCHDGACLGRTRGGRSTSPWVRHLRLPRRPLRHRAVVSRTSVADASPTSIRPGRWVMRGAASGLARLRQRLPQPADEVPGDAVDLLVVRATLTQFAGGPGRPVRPTGGGRPHSTRLFPVELVPGPTDDWVARCW